MRVGAGPRATLRTSERSRTRRPPRPGRRRRAPPAPRPRRCPDRSTPCRGRNRSAKPSMTARPSTTTRPLPACTSVNTWVPVSSGVKVVWARNDQPASPRPGTGGSRPKMSAVGEWRWSTGSPARSGPANQSTARPGCPPGAVAPVSPSRGVLRRLSQPGSWTTVTPSPRASVKRGQRGHQVVGPERGGPAAHDLGAVGVGPDDRHGAQVGAVEGEQPVVGEQDHRLGGGPAGHGPMRRVVDRGLLAGPAVVEGAHPFEHRQQAGDLGVDAASRRRHRPGRPQPAPGRTPGRVRASRGRPRPRPTPRCRSPRTSR